MQNTILSSLREFFLDRSVPAFLVGGYIRDSLRGVLSRDIDIAIQGDSLGLARGLAHILGGSYVPLGHAHRVARVVVSPPDGDRWTIDVSGIEGSLEDDLARRDFTIDAMSLPLETWCLPQWEGHVIDPYGGKSDLAQGTVRVIRPSASRPAAFSDDPARLLRGVRLAARLGAEIEPFTYHLMSEEAHLISSVSGERVRDEFLAILSLDGAKTHLEMLDGLGVLCRIIPELGIAKGVQQPKEHYWDVFNHSVHAVEGVERVFSEDRGDPVSTLVPWPGEMKERFTQEVGDGHTRRTILKLGALLHDIAKPQTKMVDAKGKTRFLGHHTLGASMSSQILHRLRSSNRSVDMVRGMIENHLRPGHMSQGGELPTPRAVYRFFRDVGDVAIDTLYLSLADHLAARGPDLEMEGWKRHTGIIAHILEVGTHEQAPQKMPRLVTGHDLIREFGQAFGLSQGPIIGELLEGVQDAQAGGEVHTREEALAWTRCQLEGKGG